MDHRHPLQTFTQATTQQHWQVINDGVMGGVSASELIFSPPDTLRFRGTVSFENNGGFASVQTPLPQPLPSEARGVYLLAQGDGHSFKFRLYQIHQGRRTRYAADFTPDTADFQLIELPFTAFAATFRGRPDRGAPPLTPALLTDWGFLISRQEGAFQLAVKELGYLTAGD